LMIHALTSLGGTAYENWFGPSYLGNVVPAYFQGCTR
jgi:hypothetical protein